MSIIVYSTNVLLKLGAKLGIRALAMWPSGGGVNFATKQARAREDDLQLHGHVPGGPVVLQTKPSEGSCSPHFAATKIIAKE